MRFCKGQKISLSSKKFYFLNLTNENTRLLSASSNPPQSFKKPSSKAHQSLIEEIRKEKKRIEMKIKSQLNRISFLQPVKHNHVYS